MSEYDNKPAQNHELPSLGLEVPSETSGPTYLEAGHLQRQVEPRTRSPIRGWTDEESVEVMLREIGGMLRRATFLLVKPPGGEAARRQENKRIQALLPDSACTTGFQGLQVRIVDGGRYRFLLLNLDFFQGLLLPRHCCLGPRGCAVLLASSTLEC
jgi:hypothetical protein